MGMYNTVKQIKKQIASLKLDAYNGSIGVNYAYSEIYRLEQLITTKEDIQHEQITKESRNMPSKVL
jgi:hypothetical protein